MTLEFENELGEIRSLTSKPRLDAVALSPLKTGELAPFFSLAGSSGNWRTTNHLGASTLSLLDLIRTKPIVVSFYCPCWGRYAGPYLDTLIRLNEDLQRAGTELVVLSNESPKILARQGRTLNFLFAHDADLRVSRQFGVYNEDSPVWDRVSGISDEAFIPALYVIGTDRRIAYHTLDENFDMPIDSAAVLSTVYSLMAIDPELGSPAPVPLNAYSRGFFACWLLGLLAAAGAHIAHC